MSENDSQLDQLKKHVDDRFEIFSQSLGEVTKALYKLVQVEERLNSQNLLVVRIGAQLDKLEQRVRSMEINNATTTTKMKTTEKAVGKYDTLLYSVVSSFVSAIVTGITVAKVIT